MDRDHLFRWIEILTWTVLLVIFGFCYICHGEVTKFGYSVNPEGSYYLCTETVEHSDGKRDVKKIFAETRHEAVMKCEKWAVKFEKHLAKEAHHGNLRKAR